MGLFIDGDDERLEQRYMGTLRRYPSAGEPLFVDRIRFERQLDLALHDRADLVIDTSLLTAADLRRSLTNPFALDTGGLRVFVPGVAW